MENNDDESTTKALHIPIHSLISSLQHNHGLLQNDFHQYRSYCTRRLSRLRHTKAIISNSEIYEAISTSSSKQKHAFVKKEIHRDIIPHENFLLIILLQAERAWAHGMEKKYQHQISKRHLYLKKFHRSWKLADELCNLSKLNSSTETILECQAYRAHLKGNWYLEKNDWLHAALEYHETIQICKTLASTVNDSYSQEVFKTRVEQVIEPVLKFCRYELMEAGMTEEHIDSVLENNFTENEKIDDSISGEATKKSVSFEVEFRNTTFEVHNEALCITLLKIDTLSTMTDINQAYDDALEIVNSEIQLLAPSLSSSKNNAKSTLLKDLRFLKQYLTFSKLQLFMKRNEELVKELLTQKKKWEDVTHVYRVLLQDSRSIVSCLLETTIEDECLLQAQAHVVRYRALYCFYLGQSYAASDSDQSYAIARALFDHALELASQAAEELSVCLDIDQQLVQNMITLEKYIAGAKCRLEASLYLNTITGLNSNRSLLDRLDEDVTIFTQNADELPFLAHLPPNLPLEYVPCKPTFFDLAWNYVGEFPYDQLQQHIDNVEQSQRGTGLLGWFRRG